MTTSIGITGTRLGATRLQMRVLMGTLLLYYKTMPAEPIELHHGACVGVDEQAALLGKALNFRVIAHPPTNHAYLSQISLTVSKLVLPEAEYLERDRDIVDNSQLLIALPNTTAENPRSGTWYTYNYAQGKNKTLMLILPDGTVR